MEKSDVKYYSKATVVTIPLSLDAPYKSLSGWVSKTKCGVHLQIIRFVTPAMLSYVC